MSALVSEPSARTQRRSRQDPEQLRSRLAGAAAKVRDDPPARAPDPVSPELVLVDAELARVERARLLAELSDDAPHPLPPTVRTELSPAVEPVAAPPPAELATPPADHLRRRVLSALLTASLFVNALFIAAAVGDATAPQPSIQAGPAATTRPAGAPSHARPPAEKPRPRPPATTRTAAAPSHARRPAKKPRPRTPALPSGGARGAAPSSAAAERRVLTRVIQAPRGKLPPRLIDRTTGLAKNGLQAVCRRVATRTFGCVVRPARHGPREGLYVRVRVLRQGRSSFRWYGYRLD
jgi:hypothetical protein